MNKTTPEEASKLAERFGFTLFGNEYRSLADLIDEVRGVDAGPYAYEWLTPNANGTWLANFGFAPPKSGVGYKNVKALYTHPAPAQPAITDVQMDLVRRYGASKTNAEIRAMLGETAKPAQEEITDAQRLDWLIEHESHVRQVNGAFVLNNSHCHASGRDAIDACIRAASAIVGNSPENPGYNGSVLLIDDEEASRIEKDLDSAAAVLEAELQKPAPLQDQRSEWLQESAYRAGASAGFNLGISEDHDGLERLKAAHAYPCPCPHGFIQPAAPVELPVVAWLEHHKAGDNLSWEQISHPYAKADALVKLSDAQAAIAAGRKAS